MTNTFQDWLRTVIEESGLSYSKIGQKGGFSHARISQVLAGEKPGAAFCVALAQALDIPTNEVLEQAGFPTVPDTPKESDPLLKRYWQLGHRLSRDRLEIIVTMIAALN